MRPEQQRPTTEGGILNTIREVFNKAIEPDPAIAEYHTMMNHVGEIVAQKDALFQKDQEIQAFMMRTILIDIHNFFAKLFHQYDVSQGMRGEYENFRKELEPFFNFVLQQLKDTISAEQVQTPVEATKRDALVSQLQSFMQELESIHQSYTERSFRDNAAAMIYTVQRLKQFYSTAK